MENAELNSTLKARKMIALRVFAKLIDFLVVVALIVLLPYPLGPLLGFLYSLLGDGLSIATLRGQSLGKKVMGLRTWSDKHPKITVIDSAIRNVLFGVTSLFALMPPWGWLLFVLVGGSFSLFELYLMLTTGKGRRLGDLMADTHVFLLSDFKQKRDQT